MVSVKGVETWILTIATVYKLSYSKLAEDHIIFCNLLP